MMQSLNPEGVAEFRMYLAEVVNVDDPLQQQRIKVTVPGLLQGDAAVLPWVSPIQSCLFGTGATYGVFGVPPVGSKVIVHFQGKDLLYGLVMGNIPLRTSELSPLTANYPRRYGFRDHVGNYFYIDTTPNETTVRFEHFSGMSFEVSNSGSVTLISPDNLQVNIQNNANVSINGTATVNVIGDTSVSTNSNLSATVAGDMSANVNGAVTINAGASIDSTAPNWTHTGPVSIVGALTVAETIAASGPISSGGTVSGASVKAGGIDLQLHVHGGIERGTGLSNPPT